MKKMLTLLLVVVVLATCMVTSAFAAKVGDTVDVAISVSGNPGFGCYTVEISYDADALKLVGMSDSGCLTSGRGTFLPNVAGNCASFFVSDLDNVTGDGNLFIVTFEVLDSAKAGEAYEVSASFQAGSLANANNEDVTMTISGGLVKIDDEPHEHVWNSGIITTPADCEHSGVKTYTCTVPGCTETKTETVPAIGHAWGEWKVTTTPTCTDKGVETRVCANDVSHTETRIIDATGHTFGEWTVTKTPTCTEEGIETRACHCGETETRTVAATGHTFGGWTVTKTPTCTEEGIETRACHCGETETRTVAATGHTFGEWTVIKAPTCTEEGAETRACHCGETETRAVAATGHSHTAVVMPPTCTEQGYTTHTCTCGDSFVDTYVEPTGHADADNDHVCDNCDASLSNAETGDAFSMIVMTVGLLSSIIVLSAPVILRKKHTA